MYAFIHSAFFVDLSDLPNEDGDEDEPRMALVDHNIQSDSEENIPEPEEDEEPRIRTRSGMQIY